MLDSRLAQRFEAFLAAASAMRQAEHAKRYPELPAIPALEAMEGQRYIRLVSRDGAQRFSYAFVDKTNGDVLKSEGWRKPAKHARSNIWDADLGLSGLSLYGARYLR